jgi:hypothetical protein
VAELSGTTCKQERVDKQGDDSGVPVPEIKKGSSSYPDPVG